MSVAEWALVASVVFSGLWAGELAMLTLVMHPMLKGMDGRDFARFLRAFLPSLGWSVLEHRRSIRWRSRRSVFREDGRRGRK